MADSKLSSLKLRVLSALVLAPVAVAAAWLAGWWLAILAAIAVVLMLYEWHRLCGVDGLWITRITAAVSVAALAVASLGWTLAALCWLLLAAAVIELASRRGGWPAGWAAGGLLYIAAPAVALTWLGFRPGQGATLVLWLFATVWATDIAAYAAGRLIGGPKLAPRISPNKTWAGLLGGLTAAAVVGAVAGAFGGLAAAPRLATLGLTVGLVSQIGDLVESRIKRGFAVKDAGSLIPGHGGVLDRLDSMLFAAPAVALLVLAGAFGGGAAWR